MPSAMSLVVRVLARLGKPMAMNTRLSIAWQRAQFEYSARIGILPHGTSILPAVIGGVKGRWITVGKTPDDMAILYFHGGAYTIGSSYTHRTIAAHVAHACGVKVLIIDYRLAPEHPYPAALEDGMNAYHTLLDKGYSHGKLVIAGDSGGGGLALATQVALRDAGTALPAAGVCLSPWADLECSGDSYSSRLREDPALSPEWLHIMARHYAGGHDLRTPTISPIHADLGGLPPLLIQVGSDEILLSDAHRLAARAKEDGVDVVLNVLDSMCHFWTLYAGVLPEAHQAVQNAGFFLRQHLGCQTDRDVL
ncbi:MAG: alpha/beta hydrolase [Syntrophaceae bacterium]